MFRFYLIMLENLMKEKNKEQTFDFFILETKVANNLKKMLKLLGKLTINYKDDWR